MDKANSNVGTAPTICIVALSLFIAGAYNVAIAADESYFQGKTFTVVVQSRAGGGTDTTARLVARFWDRHIPGKPNTVVRNKPQGVIAGNELHHNTRPDGLTVGVFAGGGSLGPLARKSSAVRYDPRQWGHVGAIERGPSVIYMRKAAVARLKDPKAAPVNVGSVSTDRPQDAMAVFAGEYGGWNIKFVLGYPSSNDVYLAYERGEIDMFASGTTKILKRLVDEGNTQLLVAETRRSDFPEIPGFVEYLGAKKPTGLAWRAYRAWAGTSVVDKYFATPPKTPDNVLATLRASFKATIEDPEFVAEANTVLGGGWVYESGEETLSKIKGALEIPEDVVGLMRKLREKYELPIGKALQ